MRRCSASAEGSWAAEVMRKTRVIILSLMLAVLIGIQLVTILIKPKIVLKGDTSLNLPLEITGREVSPVVLREVSPVEAGGEVSPSLELLGTAIGNTKDPIAFIKDLETGKQGIYKLGNTIKEAKIIRITKGAVDLEINGTKQTLWLRKAGSNYAAVNNPAILSVDGENIIVSRNALLNETGNIIESVKQVKIKPYCESQQVIGMSIEGVAQDSLIAQVGIRDKDVVTAINNQKIDSYQKALQVFNKVRNQSEIKVSLMRNGETKYLNYRFDN